MASTATESGDMGTQVKMTLMPLATSSLLIREESTMRNEAGTTNQGIIRL